MEVGLHDTIALLKYSILEAASIPIYEQRIVPSVSEEAPAHDERGLQACGFFDGVIVTMYRIPLPVPVFEVEDPFKVAIRPSKGKAFLLEVSRSDTFRAMKQKIEEAEGYPVDEQWFGYDPEFENDRTLDHFSITEPATLRLWFRKKKREGTRPKSRGIRASGRPMAAGDTIAEGRDSDWEDVSDEREEIPPEAGEEGDQNKENQ